MFAFIILMFSVNLYATELPLTPIPVFLKYGYSSVLEFDEAPTQIVLGDSQIFQIEKLKTSIVVKALDDDSSSNMFVYFKNQEPRLFILTITDEAEPTLYRKFVSLRALAKRRNSTSKKVSHFKRGTRLLKADFDSKKDFLTIEIAMMADSKSTITPYWDKVRLFHNKNITKPTKLWAERKIVQKDSRVTARFIFKRPDVPRHLTGAKLLIPIKGFKKPIRLTLNKGAR